MAFFSTQLLTMNLQLPLIFHGARRQLNVFSTAWQKFALIWLIRDENDSRRRHVAVGADLKRQYWLAITEYSGIFCHCVSTLLVYLWTTTKRHDHGVYNIITCWSISFQSRNYYVEGTSKRVARQCSIVVQSVAQAIFRTGLFYYQAAAP